MLDGHQIYEEQVTRLVEAEENERRKQIQVLKEQGGDVESFEKIMRGQSKPLTRAERVVLLTTVGVCCAAAAVVATCDTGTQTQQFQGAPSSESAPE